jgi:hypothetical protein
MAATDPARHPLCQSCNEWLWQVVSAVSSGSRPVLGAPDPSGRQRVFEDQCALCRDLLGPAASAITVAGPGRDPGALLICDACDVWLAGLADDGRSARGEAERSIDGAYGLWPHANLRDIVVALDLVEGSTRDAVLVACGEMQVRTVEVGAIANPLVVMVESSVHRPAASVLGGLRQGPRRFVLVPAGQIQDLRECIAVGIDGWLTVPVTPQQVSAALGRLVRHPGLRPRWDELTCLPVLDPRYLERGALYITPGPEATPAQSAWLVRRVSRGYDDVGVAAGQIVVVPRAPASMLDRIGERLQRALADRCSVSVPGRPGAEYRRFDVAG